MFYSDSNIFHLRICPYYRSYILPVLIFKALHFYHVHNYGSSPTFVSIFMGTVYISLIYLIQQGGNISRSVMDSPTDEYGRDHAYNHYHSSNDFNP